MFCLWEALEYEAALNKKLIDSDDSEIVIEITQDNFPNDKLRAYTSKNPDKLTTLDVKGNKKLKQLNCSYNRLTELNVRPLTELAEFYYKGNRLAAIGLSRNTNLGANIDVSGQILQNLSVTTLDNTSYPYSLNFNEDCHNIKTNYRNGIAQSCVVSVWYKENLYLMLSL